MTPPFGLLLFVMKGAAPDARMTEVYRAALPYAAIGVIGIALVMAFPELALALTRFVR
jgi:TRAP-type mannitol/chloroaromatic compound transport system permease large subunit